MSKDEHEPLTIELTRVAFWIRHYAEASGQTLNQVADFARVSRQSFYDVVKKRGNPTLRTLALISRQLGVEAVDLLKPVPDEADSPALDETPDEPSGE